MVEEVSSILTIPCLLSTHLGRIRDSSTLHEQQLTEI